MTAMILLGLGHPHHRVILKDDQLLWFVPCAWLFFSVCLHVCVCVRVRVRVCEWELLCRVSHHVTALLAGSLQWISEDLWDADRNRKMRHDDTKLPIKV